jgi:choline dehydrogenase-like flavoprotein
MPLNEPADVVVIGTGAGGGNVIRELCLKGVKVVALEAGPRWDADKDFEEDEWAMFHKLSWLDPVIGEGPDMTGLPTWICKAVGGTTTHWAGAALRIQPHEFQARSTYGDISGADLEDWPLDHDSLIPYYEEAERVLGVAGRVLPLPAGNTNFLAMKRGADQMGLHAKAGFMAINTEEYDGRAACTQRGYCFQGCRNQAKWSSLYEAIPKAEATGLLDLRANCQALHINVDAKNHIESVVYATADGQWEEQKARAVVIAGNAIQTPRLLLQSVSGKYPHGLANGSGTVLRDPQFLPTSS